MMQDMVQHPAKTRLQPTGRRAMTRPVYSHRPGSGRHERDQRGGPGPGCQCERHPAADRVDEPEAVGAVQVAGMKNLLGQYAPFKELSRNVPASRPACARGRPQSSIDRNNQVGDAAFGQLASLVPEQHVIQVGPFGGGAPVNLAVGGL